MAKTEQFINTDLPLYAEKYIDLCIKSTKQVATGSGKVLDINDRHIPTIAYFLNIWLPRNLGETITRSTYYEWFKSDDQVKSDTIKSIDDNFQALAGDIVANEGKGIFYAKNKLGWTDKMEQKVTSVPILNIDPLAGENQK